jgi:GT2 family glycosyltransferase
MATTVDILLPTYNRLASFIMTLSGVAAQDLTDLRVIVSDQSDRPVRDEMVVQTLGRIVKARGGTIEWHRRPQIHGIAEQRAFLLHRSQADWILYLDDDVFMEPWVVGRLLETIRHEQCAFVGAFPAGLSHREDERPDQQKIEYFEGKVEPEAVEPGSPQWERWKLHLAANLWHVGRQLPPGEFRTYRVAWVASCILYDRKKVMEVGGFSFWERLPRYHSGEEVLVQNLLMRRWGGCAIVPSGTYYAQLPSTVLNQEGTVDGHALDLLPALVERYGLRKEGQVEFEQS